MSLILPQRPANILICVPSYDGRVRFDLCASLVHATQLLTEHGVRFDLGCVPGAHLPLARNLFVREMLKGDFSHLLMADADMAWPAHAILSLLARGKDVCGVACQNRSVDGLWELGGPRPVSGEPGLLEVSMLGAGLVLLSRAWCSKMMAKWPSGPFVFIHEGERFQAEDFTAWHRWKSIGGKLYVDASFPVMHYAQRPLAKIWAEAEAEAQRTGKPLSLIGETLERVNPK